VTESKVPEKEQHNIKIENCSNTKADESLSNKQEVNIIEPEDNKVVQQVNDKPISMKKHMGKKAEKKKMKNSVINCEENDEDIEICKLTEGEFVLGEGETLLKSFTFCGDEIIENTN
jgi:hypothetical protein